MAEGTLRHFTEEFGLTAVDKLLRKFWKMPSSTSWSRPDHNNGNCVPYSSLESREFFNVSCWSLRRRRRRRDLWFIILVRADHISNLFAGVIAKAPKFSLVILRPWACWSSLGYEPLTFSAAVRCSTSWVQWVQPVGRCVTSRESFWGEVETPVIFPYSFNCFPRDFISTNTFFIPGNKRLSTFWRNINL